MLADKILTGCSFAWAWLGATVHPLAPWVAVVLLVWLANLGIRTWAPGAWQWVTSKGPAGAKLSKAFQALPSLLGGAIVVSLGTGADPRLTALGALAGLGAPVWHEILRWGSSKLPGPTYLGGAYPAAGTATQPAKGIPRSLPPIALLGLFVVGCIQTPGPITVAEQACMVHVPAVVQRGECDEVEVLAECPAYILAMKQCEIWMDAAEAAE